jgi:hypothetical protein
VHNGLWLLGRFWNAAMSQGTAEPGVSRHEIAESGHTERKLEPTAASSPQLFRIAPKPICSSTFLDCEELL